MIVHDLKALRDRMDAWTDRTDTHLVYSDGHLLVSTPDADPRHLRRVRAVLILFWSPDWTVRIDQEGSIR